MDSIESDILTTAGNITKFIWPVVLFVMARGMTFLKEIRDLLATQNGRITRLEEWRINHEVWTRESKSDIDRRLDRIQQEVNKV